MTLDGKQKGRCGEYIHANQLHKPLEEQLVLVASTCVVENNEVVPW